MSLSLCGHQLALLSALAQISDLPKVIVKGSMFWAMLKERHALELDQI